MELKGNPKRGLTGTTLGFFIGFAAVSLYGPTAKYFKDAMGLTPAMVGLLVSIPALSGSLLRIPFGAWVDTTGGKKPFVALLLASVIGLGGVFSILMLTYPDKMTPSLFPLILFFGFLSGCGIATFSVGIAQTSYWFPRSRQGMALGLYAGLGNVAPGLFALMLPFILKYYGIKSAYFLWFLILFIGSIIYMLVGCNAYFFQLLKKGLSKDEAEKKAKELGQEVFPSGTVLDSLKISGREWRNWALVGIYFTTFGGFIALTAWFPTYWRELYKFAPITAGILTATYSLLTSFIRVYGGGLADKLGGEKVTLGSLIILLLGGVVLTFSSSFAVSLTGAVIMAAGMGTANGSVFKLVPLYIPKAVGGAAGWIGGLGAFGGFVIPPVMGYYVSRFGESGYSLGFSVFVLLSLISLGVILLIIKLNKKS